MRGKTLGQDHEASVVEHGDSHENGVPHRVRGIDAHREEAGQEHDGQERLHRQGGRDDGLEEGGDLPHGAGPGFLCGEHALGQAQVAGHGEAEDRGERHDAQAADDDARRDDGLPERRPVGGSIDGGETCHTNGGDGREEHVDERRGRVGRGRDGQHEQEGDDPDDEREGAQSQARRRITGLARQPRAHALGARAGDLGVRPPRTTRDLPHDGGGLRAQRFLGEHGGRGRGASAHQGAGGAGVGT